MFERKLAIVQFPIRLIPGTCIKERKVAHLSVEYVNDIYSLQIELMCRKQPDLLSIILDLSDSNYESINA